MPRTRSQPLSPSGLVSLEDVSKPRYNTRNAARRRQKSPDQSSSKDDASNSKPGRRTPGRSRRTPDISDDHENKRTPVEANLKEETTNVEVLTQGQNQNQQSESQVNVQHNNAQEISQSSSIPQIHAQQVTTDGQDQSGGQQLSPRPAPLQSPFLPLEQSDDRLWRTHRGVACDDDAEFDVDDDEPFSPLGVRAGTVARQALELQLAVQNTARDAAHRNMHETEQSSVGGVAEERARVGSAPSPEPVEGVVEDSWDPNFDGFLERYEACPSSELDVLLAQITADVASLGQDFDSDTQRARSENQQSRHIFDIDTLLNNQLDAEIRAALLLHEQQETVIAASEQVADVSLPEGDDEGSLPLPHAAQLPDDTAPDGDDESSELSPAPTDLGESPFEHQIEDLPPLPATPPGELATLEDQEVRTPPLNPATGSVANVCEELAPLPVTPPGEGAAPENGRSATPEDTAWVSPEGDWRANMPPADTPPEERERDRQVEKIRGTEGAVDPWNGLLRQARKNRSRQEAQKLELQEKTVSPKEISPASRILNVPGLSQCSFRSRTSPVSAAPGEPVVIRTKFSQIVAQGKRYSEEKEACIQAIERLRKLNGALSTDMTTCLETLKAAGCRRGRTVDSCQRELQEIQKRVDVELEKATASAYLTAEETTKGNEVSSTPVFTQPTKFGGEAAKPSLKTSPSLGRNTSHGPDDNIEFSDAPRDREMETVILPPRPHQQPHEVPVHFGSVPDQQSAYYHFTDMELVDLNVSVLDAFAERDIAANMDLDIPEYEASQSDRFDVESQHLLVDSGLVQPNLFDIELQQLNQQQQVQCQAEAQQQWFDVRQHGMQLQAEANNRQFDSQQEQLRLQVQELAEVHRHLLSQGQEEARRQALKLELCADLQRQQQEDIQRQQQEGVQRVAREVFQQQHQELERTAQSAQAYLQQQRHIIQEQVELHQQHLLYQQNLLQQQMDAQKQVEQKHVIRHKLASRRVRRAWRRARLSPIRELPLLEFLTHGSPKFTRRASSPSPQPQGANTGNCPANSAAANAQNASANALLISAAAAQFTRQPAAYYAQQPNVRGDHCAGSLSDGSSPADPPQIAHAAEDSDTAVPAEEAARLRVLESQSSVQESDVSDAHAPRGEIAARGPTNVNPLDLPTFSGNCPTCGACTKEALYSVSHGIRPNALKRVRNKGDKPPPGRCPDCLDLPVDRFKRQKVNYLGLTMPTLGPRDESTPAEGSHQRTGTAGALGAARELQGDRSPGDIQGPEPQERSTARRRSTAESTQDSAVLPDTPSRNLSAREPGHPQAMNDSYPEQNHRASCSRRDTGKRRRSLSADRARTPSNKRSRISAHVRRGGLSSLSRQAPSTEPRRAMGDWPYRNPNSSARIYRTIDCRERRRRLAENSATNTQEVDGSPAPAAAPDNVHGAANKTYRPSSLAFHSDPSKRTSQFVFEAGSNGDIVGEGPSESPSPSQTAVPTTERGRSLSFRERLSGVFSGTISRLLPSLGIWPRGSPEPSPEPPKRDQKDKPSTPVVAHAATEEHSHVGSVAARPEALTDTRVRTDSVKLPAASGIAGGASRLAVSEHRPSWSLNPPPRDRTVHGLPPSRGRKLHDDESESQSHGADTTSSDVARPVEKPQAKKRKRAPSPDVIPNPKGSSYGLDLDYFCYSSESDEDEAQATRTDRTGPRVTTSQGPAIKKARTQPAAESTPTPPVRSWPAATDPYRGRYFLMPGQRPPPESPSEPPLPPAARAPAARTRASTFIPNRQGTFRLDYDDESSDELVETTPTAQAAPAATIDRLSTGPPAVPDSPKPPPRPTPRHADLPAAVTPAKIDDEALAKARSLAEKYKPKTPSGLRLASRYSSPLTAPSPASVAHESVENDFGTDEFARDAQWLYEICPSGDFEQIVWPAHESLRENLGMQGSGPALHFDEDELEQDYRAFRQTLSAFEEVLV